MKTPIEKAIDYCMEIEGQIHQPYIDAFLAGYNAANEWISVEDKLPLTYKSGSWDGLKSDEIFVKTKENKYYVAVLYSGILDGSKFNEFYESNADFEIKDITHWKTIN